MSRSCLIVAKALSFQRLASASKLSSAIKSCINRYHQTLLSEYMRLYILGRCGESRVNLKLLNYSRRCPLPTSGKWSTFTPAVLSQSGCSPFGIEDRLFSPAPPANRLLRSNCRVFTYHLFFAYEPVGISYRFGDKLEISYLSEYRILPFAASFKCLPDENV